MLDNQEIAVKHAASSTINLLFWNSPMRFRLQDIWGRKRWWNCAKILLVTFPLWHAPLVPFTV